MNPVSWGALKEKGTPSKQNKQDKNYKIFSLHSGKQEELGVRKLRH